QRLAAAHLCGGRAGPISCPPSRRGALLLAQGPVGIASGRGRRPGGTRRSRPRPGARRQSAQSRRRAVDAASSHAQRRLYRAAARRRLSAVPPGGGLSRDARNRGNRGGDAVTLERIARFERDLVVQAGAGTGKTHALVTLYLHLVGGLTAAKRRTAPS